MFWDFYAACYDTLRWLKPYQQLMQQMQRLVDVQPGQRILDAGCGTGNLTAELNAEQPGLAIDAGDASTPMLARALRKARGQAEVRCLHLNLAQALPFESDLYDRVVCCNVLYALPDPSATLREFRRVLKPDGCLVLATPKRAASITNLWRAHFRALRGLREWTLSGVRTPLIGLVHVLNLVIMARKKTARYHFLDQAGLEALLAETGFRIARLETGYADQDWLVVAEPVPTRLQPILSTEELATAAT